MKPVTIVLGLTILCALQLAGCRQATGSHGRGLLSAQDDISYSATVSDEDVTNAETIKQAKSADAAAGGNGGANYNDLRKRADSLGRASEFDAAAGNNLLSTDAQADYASNKLDATAFEEEAGGDSETLDNIVGPTALALAASNPTVEVDRLEDEIAQNNCSEVQPLLKGAQAYTKANNLEPAFDANVAKSTNVSECLNSATSVTGTIQPLSSSLGNIANAAITAAEGRRLLHKSEATSSTN